MHQNKSSKISFEGKYFYAGIDIHKKRWVVTIRYSGLTLKSLPMNPSPEALKHHLETHYPGGTYHVVYEVGFWGLCIYRKFKDLGSIVWWSTLLISPLPPQGKR